MSRVGCLLAMASRYPVTPNYCAKEFEPRDAGIDTLYPSSLARYVNCRRREPLDSRVFRLFGLLLRKGACFTGIQKLLSLNATEKLDQFRDHAGPSGLVAGSQARAIVAVEVLEE